MAAEPELRIPLVKGVSSEDPGKRVSALPWVPQGQGRSPFPGGRLPHRTRERPLWRRGDSHERAGLGCGPRTRYRRSERAPFKCVHCKTSGEAHPDTGMPRPR